MLAISPDRVQHQPLLRIPPDPILHPSHDLAEVGPDILLEVAGLLQFEGGLDVQ
jgi:hypothetical protein